MANITPSQNTTALAEHASQRDAAERRERRERLALELGKGVAGSHPPIPGGSASKLNIARLTYRAAHFLMVWL
ncbi:hypothetical protein SAMN05443247_05230 [Bradyrhizobium erythrophlei]|jgi:hypothetical protein|nr:hypothetical protein SAMN05443247_05230 [Bradyrhizobium erythrophlei]